MSPRNRYAPLSLALALLACSPDAHVPSKLEKPRTRADFPKAGQYERYLALLDEHGRIPHDALMRAKSQRDELVAQPTAGGGVSPGTWKWHGPSNIAGRMRALYIHPVLPEVMVLGSASGGIWRTEDGGGTWKVVDDWLPSLAVSSIVAHPNEPGTLYAGSGEAFASDGIPGAGIFKSEDLGKTWQRLPSTSGSDFVYVNELVISPTNARVLLAATNAGIFRSADAGQSWTRVKIGRARDVHFDPSGATAIADVLGAGWYSSDAGQSWSASTVLPADARRIEFSYSQKDPKTVYAGVSRTGFSGAWVSKDSGASFSALGARVDPYGSAGFYDNSIWVDASNDNARLVLGGVGVVVSTNDGAAWSDLKGPHADIHVLVPHPKYDGNTNQTIFIGTDGGLYRVDDTFKSTRKVTSLNEGLGTAQFYGGAVTSDGLVIGGMQDNGTYMLRSPASTRWTYLQPFDGIHCAADPVDRKVYYGTSQYSGVFRILDGGVSPDRMDPPNSVAGKSPFLTRILLDPNDSSRLYCGTHDLMVCDNTKTSAAPTWRKLTSFDTDRQYVTAIGVTPGNSNRVFHSHNYTKLYKSEDATSATPTWTQLTNPSLRRFISEIVVSPHDPDTVYVCQGGYASGNLIVSENAGRTWRSLGASSSGRLPSAPIHAFAVHPVAPDWLYVGTEIGLFVSQDGGRTWSASNEGPSNAVIDHLVFKGDRLWAFTHGRGVFSAHASTPEDSELVTRVSVSSFEFEGNAASASASIDAQARRVAFQSEASNLVAGDTNGLRDIFVRDMQSGTTELASAPFPGPRANGPSQEPCLAQEGRFVAFASAASNLVLGDTNGQVDVFVHDLQDGRTERVPPRMNITQPNGPSSTPSLTPAGRYVVFSSDASNLVIGDTNKKRDVFRYDRATGVVVRVSIAGQSGQTDDDSSNTQRAVSADGSLVVFESRATRLVGGDTNGRSDIFVRDLASGQTTRVSVSSGGEQGNGESRAPSISADGRYVAFASFADNLVPNDRNDQWDVFVHDRQSKKTERVSVPAAGGDANGSSFGAVLSPDGGFVSFYSSASNLVGGDGNKRIDVFLRDLARGTTSRVSVDVAGREADGASANPDVAAMGASVAFQSLAKNLVPDDRNGVEDVFASAPGRDVIAVWPASRAILDGLGASTQYFRGSSRSQHVYRGGAGAQFQVDGLALRRDAGNEAPKAVARRVTLEVLAGPADIDAMSGDFAKTFTSPPSVVFSRKPISLPDLRTVPPSLPAFRIRVPFDQPYVHDGARELGFELREFGSSDAGAYPLDMHGELDVVRSASTVLGTGCKTPNGSFAFDASYASSGQNSQLGVKVSGALPKSPLYMMLGAVDPDLPVQGLCAKLRTLAIVNLFVGVSDDKGERNTEFGVSPWTPSLLGAELTAQLLTLDFQQQIPLSLSNGLRITLPKARPGPSARSVFAASPSATSGKLVDEAFTIALESR